MERLTPQKLDTLRFAGRQRCVRPIHIEARFGVDRSTAYRHLASLTKAGLLERFNLISSAGGVFAATRKGLALSQLGLRPAEPDMCHLAHDEAMTEVVCDLESQRVDLLTERELYAYRRTVGDGRYDFEKDDLRGGWVPHTPDMICEIPRANKFMVIEVELSPKNVDRWRATFRGFYNRLDVDGFIGVLYVADSSARPKRLKELAQEAGLGERFQLRLRGEQDPLDGLNSIVDAAKASAHREAA